jgi:hypothetical protein
MEWALLLIPYLVGFGMGWWVQTYIIKDYW